MGYINEHRPLFKQLMDMLEKQFGPNSEFVLHDMTLPYEKTIVDIRNGHITGRTVGDSGSNLGLEVLRGTVKDGDRYNYVTYLKSSRILRSSSMYMYDEQGQLVASLCVNTDITEEVKFEDYLKKRNNFSLPAHEGREREYTEVTAESHESEEFFPDSVQDLLGHLIHQSQKAVNVPVAEMGRDDKINFIRLLDRKGAFLITKSSEAVCEYLDISKFSLYRYLDVIRTSNGGNAGKAECE